MKFPPRRRAAGALFAAVSALAVTTPAFAVYSDWSHSGRIVILTTPEGAAMPAGTSVESFPLLVRLDKEWFDFKQPKPDGADIRFSSADGAPLAYQVEEWDPLNGTASLWVRIPKIEGNARQTIRLHWGKADAASESSGKAVFNESNGYLSVWHLGDTVTDDAGTLQSKDTGTTTTGGLIGKARHFKEGCGISGGEKISGYPSGPGPHSSEAWFRAEKPNGTVLGWGNEQAQGKVVMQFQSPPHVRMDCYFSGANVESTGRMAMREWVHVVHTCQKGDSRLYVNGVLAGTSTRLDSPLDIKSPARLWIGGWYHHYNFTGDIDEVRISKVVRSPEWVRLQYENQKPLQTLVGPVIQPGTTFFASPSRATVLEGKTAVFTADAGGAQKVYWLLRRHGQETVVATDRFSYTFAAGRVTGDESATLVFKGVYPGEVTVSEIALTIKEDIPEPVFTLKAPAAWDGRTALEIVPQIENLTAMEAKGAGDVEVTWKVTDIATIKETPPGKLRLKRAQNSGRMAVTATMGNGGQPATQTVAIAVTEPKTDPWIPMTPAKDEKPVNGQFYARDGHNEGTLHYNGILTEPAEAVFLKVYADDKPFQTVTATPAADQSYALSAKLTPGLIKYKVEFGTKSAGQETVRETVHNLVCGDAWIITGQSNALATDTGEKSPPVANEWIRSYGRPPQNAKDVPGNLWCHPVWKSENEKTAELGWWGMELAKRLLESQKMPVFIINGAVGGTRIDQHQRNAGDPADLSTIYGRTLWRVQRARLTHGIRGILWHQGENNQGTAGPSGDFDWKDYQNYFVELSAGWKQDYPNLQHYYVFQIWPDACAMGGKTGGGDMIREIQRTLPRLYSNMSVMSTLGITPPGGCHYPLAGWSEFARLIQPLIERDTFGRKFTGSITPPNLVSARFASAARDSIALEFDQPIVWAHELAGQFYLDGAGKKIASGTLSGHTLTLHLQEPSAAARITYLQERDWSQGRLISGTNGIAALSFCDVPLGAPQDAGK